MATEAPPTSVEDKDFFVPLGPQTPEEKTAEDAAGAALQKGDTASYFLWFHGQERKLGNQPDPIAHAHLLVRSAQLFKAANEYENATIQLLRAARLYHGRDANDERMAIAFLKEVGGPKALDELATEMRHEIGERIAVVQRELIELQLHNSEGAKKFATKEELDNRVASLKAENQRLSNDKAAFMEKK